MNMTAQALREKWAAAAEGELRRAIDTPGLPALREALERYRAATPVGVPTASGVEAIERAEELLDEPTASRLPESAPGAASASAPPSAPPSAPGAASASAPVETNATAPVETNAPAPASAPVETNAPAPASAPGAVDALDLLVAWESASPAARARIRRAHVDGLRGVVAHIGLDGLLAMLEAEQ